MIYLAMVFWWTHKEDCDVVIVDVLPTPAAFIKTFLPAMPVLYYCHFPDKLITAAGRSDAGANPVSLLSSSSSSSPSSLSPPLGKYRQFLNWLEDQTTVFCDITLVNSEFTKSVFLSAFGHWKREEIEEVDEDGNVLDPDREVEEVDLTLAGAVMDKLFDDGMTQLESEALHQAWIQKRDKHLRSKIPEVLYPPIDVDSFAKPLAEKEKLASFRKGMTIVSMNRFERKKNVGLAIETFKEVMESSRIDSATKKKLKLIIAGGYDPENGENKDYLGELEELCRDMELTFEGEGANIEFLTSVSDEKKAELFQTSLCALYTPENEHFGIVPLEVMYSGTPIIACNSGGPRESVVNGITGFLCDQTPAAFAERVVQLIGDGGKTSISMGREGHARVKDKFGLATIGSKYKDFLNLAIKASAANKEFVNDQNFNGFMTLFLIATGILVTIVCSTYSFFSISEAAYAVYFYPNINKPIKM